jgi:hypothetical protein
MRHDPDPKGYEKMTGKEWKIITELAVKECKATEVKNGFTLNYRVYNPQQRGWSFECQMRKGEIFVNGDRKSIAEFILYLSENDYKNLAELVECI